MYGLPTDVLPNVGEVGSDDVRVHGQTENPQPDIGVDGEVAVDPPRSYIHMYTEVEKVNEEVTFLRKLNCESVCYTLVYKGIIGDSIT